MCQIDYFHLIFSDWMIQTTDDNINKYKLFIVVQKYLDTLVLWRYWSDIDLCELKTLLGLQIHNIWNSQQKAKQKFNDPFLGDQKVWNGFILKRYQVPSFPCIWQRERIPYRSILHVKLDILQWLLDHVKRGFLRSIPRKKSKYWRSNSDIYSNVFPWAIQPK